MEARLEIIHVAGLAWRQCVDALDRFCFEPVDLRIIGVIRVLYALLLAINVLCWAPDLLLWFGEAGVLPYASARAISDPDTITLFAFLPHTDFVVQVAYTLLLIHILLLGLGFKTRFQAVASYIWLLSFQNRNLFLFDGQDNVFRLLGLALIFLPSGATYSLDARRRRRAGNPYPQRGSAWALRLVQFQITVIYTSTAWEKLRSEDWTSGTALYYVSRLDDFFGHYPIPSSILESLNTLKFMTWTSLAIELSLPLLLWIPRTRLCGVFLAIAFHLCIEYAMTVFLFEWIMVVGVLSFFRIDDLTALRRWAAHRA